jgi:transposase
MRFAGIDIGSERHVVALVDETGAALEKPVSFGEEAAGYRRLRELLGDPADCLVAMEATGHYWRNLFAFLVAEGFTIALVNPLRTRRFAEEELERTKTDAIDAQGIARFAAQKRPTPTQLPEAAVEELRELVRVREQTVQQLGDRVRHLHHAIDLGFPEFTRFVRGLDTELATAIFSRYPTAEALRRVPIRQLTKLCYDGRRRVGDDLARTLIGAAKVSVGQHHSEPYRLQVRYACEDIAVLRRRVRDLEGDIERRLNAHEVGKLLTTIVGVGPLTAACIIAETSDPSRLRSAGALASYVGVVPRLHQSGKRKVSGGVSIPLGNARLRRALWMPVLVAVRLNPWLRAYYFRLRSAGKRPKVAMIATMHKLLAAVYSVAKNRRPFVIIQPASATMVAAQ